MAYVKATGSDTWHWCRNCSNYPANPSTSRQTKPSSGELCNQCQAKQREGNCS